MNDRLRPGAAMEVSFINAIYSPLLDAFHEISEI